MYAVLLLKKKKKQNAQLLVVEFGLGEPNGHGIVLVSQATPISACSDAEMGVACETNLYSLVCSKFKLVACRLTEKI